MRTFKKAADAIQKSPVVIPITLVFLALLIISVMIMFEDYSTSLAGYQALPTRKANEWIEYFVAAIPQLAQVALVYIFIDNTTKKWAILGGFGAWLLDSGLDIYYKAHDLGWAVFATAVLETTIIYTLGSEIMFTISLAMLLQLLPAFTKQLGEILAGISGNGAEGLANFFKRLNVIPSDKKEYVDPEEISEPRPSGRPTKKMSQFKGFDEVS